jgi:hypothetical protein
VGGIDKGEYFRRQIISSNGNLIINKHVIPEFPAVRREISCIIVGLHLTNGRW